MDHKPKCRTSAKTVKLEENIGENLCDVGLGKDLLPKHTKTIKRKGKN